MPKTSKSHTPLQHPVPPNTPPPTVFDLSLSPSAPPIPALSPPRQPSGGFSALFEIAEHIKRALGAPGRVVSPASIVKNLRAIGRSFRLGRQEDAHEFARYLIEAMQKDSLRGRKVPAAVAETSFVSQVFGGCLRSQVKCACGRASNTYDPILVRPTAPRRHGRATAPRPAVAQ